ncbi:NAD-dependent epimerase/dehydratase family protein [Pseudomonas sp. CCC3.1]|uniref:NAD-dependent epimerase/dehydratase family protein n=1 Tax=Pseudomonas sp. CCC3.1 TaxID=3048607 RepID=UPI002AC9F0C0|nr:NAD-dependent epimerase/dehydratase family protein [Pseudomonas sp. CCC3.1]MEB0206807.1 NAD(P)H-binding protein [Pseudomonas sp. CCC3.1]WPX37571.1 NAD-dependent epimerase/dehydratase family protein [Pseudomonas sp. CCC3.1]
MRILIFGATGMVGQGVLREALGADDVSHVLSIGRSTNDASHPKLRTLMHTDLLDYTTIEEQLTGFDACFFCLGASAMGMDEARYTHINHDIALTAGRVLSRLNPQLTFTYVSGAGTGSQSAMWARVKRRTENDLLALPFKAAYMFRPGVIQPLHGARSKTPMYNAFYVLTSPLLSLARRLLPQYVLSTEEIGLAMLEVARHGALKKVLETADIRALVKQPL